ncbi:MAG: hypothetical protein HY717_09365 [Planctomycetes bacterium]|nr:hypothetical protein [Planctomycetota bacterium]
MHLVRAIDSCPSIYSSDIIGGRIRSVDSLIESICRCEPSGIDFVLPTRALLGQSFQFAKINFFKAILYILNAISQPSEQVQQLVLDLRGILGDATYFKLFEELLIGSLSNLANPMPLKQASANLLIPIWEHRLMVPIEDFTGLLLSAWRARCRVQETFGTLVGIYEVFSLLRAECEPRFLDFFTREFVTADELEAFREFLFGLSYEDLKKLRLFMEDNKITSVGPEEVRQILGHAISTHYDPEKSPQMVYISYRRRRIRADYRVLTGSPGPQKTAEGYLLQYHLLQSPKGAAASMRVGG